MYSVARSRVPGCASFRQVAAAFLSQPGLPFAQILSAERIERIFAEHGNLFGMSAVYSTVVTLWAFLGQVLRDGKEAACQSAVAAVVACQELAGLPAPTADTGDYCRARAKLCEAALHDLAVETAEELEEQADPAWLWKGRHAKLVDGFTVTMPDTKANQLDDRTLIFPGDVISWDPFDSPWAPSGCWTGGSGGSSANSPPTASSPRTSGST